MAAVIADNGPMMFPTDGPPRRSGWSPVELSPEGREQCRRLAEQLEATLVPAAREEIITRLTRLSAHFWSDHSEDQWRIIFTDYASELAEVPSDILEAGIVRYRQHHKWWPKVSELLDQMRGPLSLRRTQLARLRRLAGETTPASAAPERRGLHRLGDVVPGQGSGRSE